MPEEQEHTQPAAEHADAATNGPEPKPDDEPRKKKGSRHPEHAARQAARYRVERNDARIERDEARLELAFVKAAGGRFVDASAAFKLVDRAVLSLGQDGGPVGLDESIDALAEANPFLLADSAKAKSGSDPFKPTRSSGRLFNGAKKPLQTGPTRKQLEERYPALRRGR